MIFSMYLLVYLIFISVLRCASCVQRRLDRAGQPTDIYIFYYGWYGNMTTDGRWRHWNADVRIEGGDYEPDKLDLPSVFYPQLGAYSSSDNSTIHMHMDWINRAGVGVVVVSWWGRNSFEDLLVPTIMDYAHEFGLKVVMYVEPYGGGYVDSNRLNGTRTPYTARDDVIYLIDTYGSHPSYHHIDGRPLVMFFAARQYKNGKQDEWKVVWDDLHSQSQYNPIVITHDIDLEERVVAGSWDGGHDYDCLSALDASKSWKSLAESYHQANKLLFFNVCPGFDKSRSLRESQYGLEVLPRDYGATYETLWDRATSAMIRGTTYVAIVSFNEWHEGSSIEPVIPMSRPPYEGIVGNAKMPIGEHTYQNFNGAFGKTGEDANYAYLDQTMIFAQKYLSLNLTYSPKPLPPARSVRPQTGLSLAIILFAMATDFLCM